MNLEMFSWPKAVWHFCILPSETIASLVCQLAPAFSMTYFLPTTQTCLIPALCLPPVLGVFPVAAGPHSSLRVPSPSVLLMGRLDCCQTLLPYRLYLVLQLILQLQQPLKADRMNCLLPGSNVYLPLDLTICCDLATQVNAIFSFFFFLLLLSLSLLQEFPPPLPTSAPWKWRCLHWDWWMCLVLFFSFPCCPSFKAVPWSNLWIETQISVKSQSAVSFLKPLTICDFTVVSH